MLVLGVALMTLVSLLAAQNTAVVLAAALLSVTP
jgi:hypothetical protein